MPVQVKLCSAVAQRQDEFYGTINIRELARPWAVASAVDNYTRPLFVTLNVNYLIVFHIVPVGF